MVMADVQVADVQVVGDNGVAIDTEQSLLGYGCVAAGVRGTDGRVIGVLGVVGRAHSLIAPRLTRPVRDRHSGRGAHPVR